MYMYMYAKIEHDDAIDIYRFSSLPARLPIAISVGEKAFCAQRKFSAFLSIFSN